MIYKCITTKSFLHLCLRRQSQRLFFRGMASDQVKVEVKQGVLLGKENHLPNGQTYNSFQGVPYAVPPLGELRFKSPVPLERFSEPELDCTHERDVSHQKDLMVQEVIGSEDCLFLNVYAPKTKQQAPLPVMVWIHGGGFFFGSGNSQYYFPQKLMEEGVIVVTCNYRLGALGFLSLPEAGIWGNAGLKDQRMVLEWVQQNISQFNGDPSNVTLFGESAGAASVHLHMYAKHANKLFHKAIMQSGTGNMEWVFQVNPLYKTRRLSELLGCKSSNSKQIIEFLQSSEVSADAILSQTISVLTPEEQRRGLPFAFKVVVEDESSPDSIVDASILEMMQRKNVCSMPTILGYNSAEGLTMTVNAIKKLPQIDEDLGRFVPRNIDLPPGSRELQAVTQRMRDFYMGGRAVSKETLNELTNILTDYHFMIDLQLAAEKHVRHQPHSPLYFYRFNYQGYRNFYKRLFQLDHLRGVCHADELFYLFQMADDSSQPHPDDDLMARRLAKLWANFARCGNPTPVADDPIFDVSWKPVARPNGEDDPLVLDYLEIGKNLEMSRQPDHERVEFWREIYRKYPPIDYADYLPMLAKL